jgi:hypothetical protein
VELEGQTQMSGTSRKIWLQYANGRVAFDSHKVVWLNLGCVGFVFFFRLRGNAACCNTAAESRRESGLVDVKDIRLPFLVSHCPVSGYGSTAKEAKQRLAMSLWIH